jgi:hypothetical protein
MIEAILSFETSILTGATRRHIPEDDILHHYRLENLSLKDCCYLPIAETGSGAHQHPYLLSNVAPSPTAQL